MVFIVNKPYSENILTEGEGTLTQTNAKATLATLKDTLALPKLVKIGADPYQTLVITIISQNTADTNTERAYKNLAHHFQITPKTLAEAPTSQIEECLKVGGLYRSKAHTIQTASKIILEKFNGSLNPILSLPVNQAREILTEMPGVGPKTADVVLLFAAGKPTIPVDTHVNRVTKRLGWAPQNGGYETVRLSLQSLFLPKDYLDVHLLLIALGRKYCKAQKPLCTQCPVGSYCPSNSGGGKA